MASIPEKRKQLKREISERRKQVLPRLKAAVKASERDRKKRLKQCQTDCRTAIKSARKKALVARRKLEQHIKRAKARAAETCKSCKVIDQRGMDEISRSLEALDIERKEINRLRAEASMLISERGRKGGRKAAELRAESDEEVVRNLGEDKMMVELFKQQRGKIRETKHRSRTEAFLEWVHDHPEALDELRSKKERKFEEEAERLFRERQPEPNTDELEQCQRELAELKAAEKFLKEADIPF